MKLSWKPGAQITKDLRDVVLEEVQRLADERGMDVSGLTPDELLEYASDPASPIHPVFEWDDNKAAHSYRLTQARHILNHVQVIIEESPQRAPVRYFVNVTEGERRHYVPLPRVLSDEELREQMMDRALDDLTRIQERYSQLEELVRDIEGVKTKYRKKIAA